MFRRNLFFWLEKLMITPSERKTMSALIVLLMGFGILNVILTPSSPFTGEYHELEQQFKQRTELIKKQERELMSRYEPSLGLPGIVENKSDTIPADTAQDQEQEVVKKSSPVSQINVNTASFAELQKLPGIGPAYSKRIIEYREKHGKFTSVDELIEIKGIGKKRLEKLQPFVKLKEPK